MTAQQIDGSTRLRMELELRRRRISQLSLQDFIPAARPGFESPEHLIAFTNLFELAETEEVRALCSTPPQHFKTSTATGALVRATLRRPARYMYVTYSHDRAVGVQKEALAFALGAGVAFTRRTDTEWVLANGASIRWLGFDGAIGGSPVDGGVLLDDPYKGMEQARSEATRRHIETAWRSIVWPRMHPGAWAIMISTRWALDDLFGILQEETFPSGNRWRVVNLPAIWPDGSPLLPCRADCLPRCSKHRPLWWLADKRAGMDPYSWEAEYMGRPRVEGMAVFGQTRTYASLPRAGIRRAIGIDLAYTEKSSADWATAVVLAVEGDGAYARYYVEKVVRGQMLLPVFCLKLSELKSAYPTAPMFIFYGGQEKTIIREVLNRPLRSGGWELGVKGAPALVDKLARAQAVSGAWNAGRVFVPEQNVEWLGPFMKELGRFTGTQADKNDDQVDALAAAFHVLSRGQKVAVLGDSPPGEAPVPSGPDAQADLAFQAMLRQQGL